MDDLADTFSGVTLSGDQASRNYQATSHAQALPDDEDVWEDEPSFPAANPGSFAKHSRAERDHIRKTVQLIRKDLSNKDVEPAIHGQPSLSILGIVYVAKEMQSDFVKAGYSTDPDDTRFMDITTRCGVLVEKSYRTRPFYGAYRAEQLLHRVLYQWAHHRHDCKCGKKSCEWYKKNFGDVITLVNLVQSWMAQEPYNRKSGKLRDKWKEALRLWDASQDTLEPLELSEFLLMGLELRLPCRILPTQSPSVRKPKSASTANLLEQISPISRLWNRLTRNNLRFWLQGLFYINGSPPGLLSQNPPGYMLPPDAIQSPKRPTILRPERTPSMITTCMAADASTPENSARSDSSVDSLTTGSKTARKLALADGQQENPLSKEDRCFPGNLINAIEEHSISVEDPSVENDTITKPDPTAEDDATLLESWRIEEHLGPKIVLSVEQIAMTSDFSTRDIHTTGEYDLLKKEATREEKASVTADRSIGSEGTRGKAKDQEKCKGQEEERGKAQEEEAQTEDEEEEQQQKGEEEKDEEEREEVGEQSSRTQSRRDIETKASLTDLEAESVLRIDAKLEIDSQNKLTAGIVTREEYWQYSSHLKPLTMQSDLGDRDKIQWDEDGIPGSSMTWIKRSRLDEGSGDQRVILVSNIAHVPMGHGVAEHVRCSEPLSSAASTAPSQIIPLSNGTGITPFQPNTGSGGDKNCGQSIAVQQPYQKYSYKEMRLGDYGAEQRFGDDKSEVGKSGASIFSHFGPSTNAGLSKAKSNLFADTNLLSTPFANTRADGFGSGSLIGIEPTDSPFNSRSTSAQVLIAGKAPQLAANSDYQNSLSAWELFCSGKSVDVSITNPGTQPYSIPPTPPSASTLGIGNRLLQIPVQNMIIRDGSKVTIQNKNIVQRHSLRFLRRHCHNFNSNVSSSEEKELLRSSGQLSPPPQSAVCGISCPLLRYPPQDTDPQLQQEESTAPSDEARGIYSASEECQVATGPCRAQPESTTPCSGLGGISTPLPPLTSQRNITPKDVAKKKAAAQVGQLSSQFAQSPAMYRFGPVSARPNLAEFTESFWDNTSWTSALGGAAAESGNLKSGLEGTKATDPAVVKMTKSGTKATNPAVVKMTKSNKKVIVRLPAVVNKNAMSEREGFNAGRERSAKPIPAFR